MSGKPIDIGAIKAFVECVVCHEVCRNVKIQPCFHMICVNCLNNLAEERGEDKLNCVVCTCPFSTYVLEDRHENQFLKNVIVGVILVESPDKVCGDCGKRKDLLDASEKNLNRKTKNLDGKSDLRSTLAARNGSKSSDPANVYYEGPASDEDRDTDNPSVVTTDAFKFRSQFTTSPSSSSTPGNSNRNSCLSTLPVESQDNSSESSLSSLNTTEFTNQPCGISMASKPLSLLSSQSSFESTHSSPPRSVTLELGSQQMGEEVQIQVPPDSHKTDSLLFEAASKVSKSDRSPLQVSLEYKSGEGPVEASDSDSSPMIIPSITFGTDNQTLTTTTGSVLPGSCDKHESDLKGQSIETPPHIVPDLETLQHVVRSDSNKFCAIDDNKDQKNGSSDLKASLSGQGAPELQLLSPSATPKTHEFVCQSNTNTALMDESERQSKNGNEGSQPKVTVPKIIEWKYEPTAVIPSSGAVDPLTNESECQSKAVVLTADESKSDSEAVAPPTNESERQSKAVVSSENESECNSKVVDPPAKESECQSKLVVPSADESESHSDVVALPLNEPETVVTTVDYIEGPQLVVPRSHKSATSFCCNCSRGMCHSCATEHLDTTSSKEHYVWVTSESVDMKELIKSVYIQNVKCRKNHSISLQMYCHVCEQRFCSLCEGHEDHKKETISDMNNKCEELVSYSALFDEALEKVDQLRKKSLASEIYGAVEQSQAASQSSQPTSGNEGSKQSRGKGETKSRNKKVKSELARNEGGIETAARKENIDSSTPKTPLSKSLEPKSEMDDPEHQEDPSGEEQSIGDKRLALLLERWRQYKMRFDNISFLCKMLIQFGQPDSVDDFGKFFKDQLKELIGYLPKQDADELLTKHRGLLDTDAKPPSATDEESPSTVRKYSIKVTTFP